MEMVRVFIGSDERGGRGEFIMDYGIRKYASRPVEVTVMEPNESRYGHWGGAWNRNRDHMRPYAGGHATNFTVFRWTIPEAAGFVGRAIYMDADQTVHGDVAELHDTPLDGKPCAIRMGVIVFDCEHPFWRSDRWPKIADMRPSGWTMGDYQQRIKASGGWSDFPVEWDVLDGKEMSVWDAKLNHYTNMRTQPYHPFPDRFTYPTRHPKPEVDEVWWRQYLEALCHYDKVPVPQFQKFDNIVKTAVEMERARGMNCFGRYKGYKYHFTVWPDMLAEAARVNPQGWRGGP